jgi:transcriptional regulator with XRE-family HTH domain
MTLLKDRIGEAMRRNPHLSQAAIARACGVRTPSVNDWISGKTKSLKPEPARRAAKLFGCDQNWLATGIGIPNWTDPESLATSPVAEQATRTLRLSIETLGALLAEMDDLSRAQFEPLLRALASSPERAHDIANRAESIAVSAEKNTA